MRSAPFYLGREYDPAAGAVTDRPVLYPPGNLTTHAVILGMTGSGKTGLGAVLLEEALLQGIPTLILDPKGDMTNLLLTFPNLSPEEFAPWIDAEAAEREGRPVQEVAAEEARRWREGLAQWDVGPERIAQLRERAEFVIFTPGSTAGTPVNVLHRFRAPRPDEVVGDEELQERVGGLVSALLGLMGREADPLQSPEHIFLSRLAEHAWRNGQDLDLPTLIRQIQDPPIRQIGVFELESFFPQKERLALARALNGILAAPGFEAWRAGVPLEVKDLLRTSDGRPRASIFYLSHLADTERAFFVTLLLEAVRDWMFAQSGTSNLRAILYFDEVLGFFPPHPANPPTKRPLMTLIKQGRAVGLGVVLATQNPADIDYKGLTNAGTWAVGLLRTDRDKERVLEGMEGAAATAGSGLNRATLDRAISALRPRVFILHDVKAEKMVFLHTRWAMSYLRGPLTRAQIRQLPRPEFATPPATPVPAPSRPMAEIAPPVQPVPAPAPAPAQPAPAGWSSVPPTLPPDIPQVFIPAAVTLDWALHEHEQKTGQTVLVIGRRLVYQPRLLAMGTVHLADEKMGLHEAERVVRLLDPPPPPAQPNWEEGKADIAPESLSQRPLGEGVYGPLPPQLAQVAQYTRWSRLFSDFLYRNIRLTLWYNPVLKVYSCPGESERDFRRRCEDVARARRDEEAARVRARYEKQIARIQQQMWREQQELAQDQVELEARKREETLSYGEAALNLLTRRRPSYMISSVSRKRRLTQQAEADVKESEETIRALQKQLDDLAARMEEEVDALNDRWAAVLDDVRPVEVAPRRTDVMVDYCGLAWVPFWEVEGRDGERLLLPAFGGA
ncbi:MAG: DUF87 domain-containing protein [Thermoflexales bacterium]|nr:DUF87 domain-containing protein [Thermoflexales bacterium]